MVKKRVSKKIAKLVKNYIKRLEKEKNVPVERVILYGSQVKGAQRKDSDIDICVISSKFKNILKAMKFLWIQRNDEEVMAGLEPIGFTKKDFNEGSSLIEEIKKTGIEIR